MPPESQFRPSVGINPVPRRLRVVAACRACDAPILEIAARKLTEFLPACTLSVVVPNKDCGEIRSRLGMATRIIPEDDFIPGMTLGQLREMKVPHFPRAAGWYFQQLLKLQFAFMEPEEDYYLIWDADTIPVRPMQFFDANGKMLLTRAIEYHAPYFETYRRILGEEPNREFSFIAQHMLVQKSIAREMLARIDQHVAGGGNWPWKIMRTLPDTGDNLFSEYETYGHYVKNHHPERVAIVERPWRREYKLSLTRGAPSESEINALASRFEYVAFEKPSKGWWQLAKAMRARFLGA